MDNILKKIDKLLCDYLGLEKDEFIPQVVSKKGHHLFILNTESCKRHIYKTPFSEINLSTIAIESRKKLGVALGKAIAKNLVVSFEEVTIQKEEAYER